MYRIEVHGNQRGYFAGSQKRRAVPACNWRTADKDIPTTQALDGPCLVHECFNQTARFFFFFFLLLTSVTCSPPSPVTHSNRRLEIGSGTKLRARWGLAWFSSAGDEHHSPLTCISPSLLELHSLHACSGSPQKAVRFLDR